MPCLSNRYDPSVGLLINVGVLPSGGVGADRHIAHLSTFPALIDTGATLTCISSAVASAVGLQPTGMRPMTSATHSVPVNTYLVDLVLPFGNTGFIVSSMPVMEFNPDPQSPFQMLLGRDIICQGMLTMSFDGHFTLCLG